MTHDKETTMYEIPLQHLDLSGLDRHVADCLLMAIEMDPHDATVLLGCLALGMDGIELDRLSGLGADGVREVVGYVHDDVDPLGSAMMFLDDTFCYTCGRDLRTDGDGEDGLCGNCADIRAADARDGLL